MSNALPSPTFYLRTIFGSDGYAYVSGIANVGPFRIAGTATFPTPFDAPIDFSGVNLLGIVA